MKKRSALWGAALAATGAAVISPLAGLAQAASGHASVNAGSIAIGYENNGADPSLISIANGYFKKDLGSGVQLKLYTSGPAALSSLASGSLPFMCGLGFPPVISAIAKGVPLQVIFSQERYTNDSGLVVKSSSGIKSVKQLAGKKVGIVVGSQASFELATYAKQAGLKLSSIQQVNLEPSAIQSAWTTGQIDAAVVWDPVFDYLRTHGGRVLETDSKLPATGSSYNICVANKQYAASHASVAEAFEKALGQGVEYFDHNKAKATSLVAKTAGISNSVAQTEEAGYQFFDLKDQLSPSVLGSPGKNASSGIAQSLLNNWKALYAAGAVTTKPPSSAAAYVNSTYAAHA